MAENDVSDIRIVERQIVVDRDTTHLEGYRLLIHNTNVPPVFVIFANSNILIVSLDDEDSIPISIVSNTQKARIQAMDKDEAKLILDWG